MIKPPTLSPDRLGRPTHAGQRHQYRGAHLRAVLHDGELCWVLETPRRMAVATAAAAAGLDAAVAS